MTDPRFKVGDVIAAMVAAPGETRKMQGVITAAVALAGQHYRILWSEAGFVPQNKLHATHVIDSFFVKVERNAVV